jgi:hypothetical protein
VYPHTKPERLGVTGIELSKVVHGTLLLFWLAGAGCKVRITHQGVRA